MSARKVRMIVRVQPSAQDAMQMASKGIAAGKLSSHDAQTVERCINGKKVIPADVLHRVKQGAK
ncbi:hypothetical protein EOS_33045 [Caballeronia mineralivorans PML1(12)]|uniref:Uncharacterized protein n=1 Tax=Caballeronia mineralivorans PML1(12) TaxID=908627 RepID=A0A0J1CMG3_9BURK|nr:hypothetical protein [Caballeronia mineralivorans]KLU21970.1 hypothetical protein EOS_33045 [Caballeronia mineralivorans PML1(12)]